MRPAQFVSTAAVALVLATGCGASPTTGKPAKPRATATPVQYTAREVITFFRDLTNDALQADAYSAFDSITVGDSDFDTEEIARERYGSFTIYVLKQPTATAIYKTDDG